MADQTAAARKTRPMPHPESAGPDSRQVAQRHAARGLSQTAGTLNARPALAAQRALAGRLTEAAPVQARLLERPVPAQRRVIQRATVNLRPTPKPKKNPDPNKIVPEPKFKPGTISGIKFGKRPTSNSKIQGQHLTAYVTFESMILSHTLDRTVGSAAIALNKIVADFLQFFTPSNHTNYLVKAMDRLEEDLSKIHDRYESGKVAQAALDLGVAIDTMLSIRNKIPGSAMATRNTGGHGESKPNGELMEMEKALLRSNGPPSDWDQGKIARQAGLAMWRLLDANPVSKTENGAIAAMLIKHMKQMRLSFPKVFAWLTDNTAWHMKPLLLLNDNTLPLHSLEQTKRKEVMELMTKAGW